MNTQISVSNFSRETFGEYRSKWHNIGLGTQTIDPDKARSTIGVLYRTLGLNLPKVEFVCGIGDFEQRLHSLKQPPGFPNVLLPESLRPDAMSLTGLVRIYFDRHLIQPLKTQLPQAFLETISQPDRVRQDADTFQRLIVKEFATRYGKERQLRLSGVKLSSTQNRGERLFDRSYSPQIAALKDGAWLDWAISEWNLGSQVTEAWWLFKMLARHTSFIYPTQDLCLVCDRPKRLVLESDRTGKPAIDYADGFRVYAVDGRRIPPEIGAIPMEEGTRAGCCKSSSIAKPATASPAISKTSRAPSLNCKPKQLPDSGTRTNTSFSNPPTASNRCCCVKIAMVTSFRHGWFLKVRKPSARPSL